MDIKNLIERLDQYSQSLIAYKLGADFADACMDAATALSTLQAENAQLRADLEYEREHADAYYEECGQWEAENEKLRAELEQVKVERDAYQAYFKDLSSKPDCNTCEKRNCDYRPKLGATVRANCPLYSGPQKED